VSTTLLATTGSNRRRRMVATTPGEAIATATTRPPSSWSNRPIITRNHCYFSLSLSTRQSAGVPVDIWNAKPMQHKTDMIEWQAAMKMTWQGVCLGKKVAHYCMAALCVSLLLLLFYAPQSPLPLLRRRFFCPRYHQSCRIYEWRCQWRQDTASGH
jgi:hypothetical protein